jgi:hypothetical protein
MVVDAKVQPKPMTPITSVMGVSTISMIISRAARLSIWIIPELQPLGSGTGRRAVDRRGDEPFLGNSRASSPVVDDTRI